MEPKYRHELKYLVSAAQIPLLKSRISGIMQPDPHAGPDGTYTIRSLYFDDYHNRCYYENENGTDPREKFRIRIYNGSTDRITLECKRKERGKTLKTSCPLTLSQTRFLIRGQVPPMEPDAPALLRKLMLYMRIRGLKPVVIVEYQRMPFVHPNGNVRVTFDTFVSSSPDAARFLAPNIVKRPVMPRGMQLMEVKFDEFLPDVIYRALNPEGLHQTAYSKYYLCRKYTIPK